DIFPFGLCERRIEIIDLDSKEVSKSLQAMKEILCGTTDKEPPTEVVAQLAQELYNSGLLVTLIANLQLIDFEGKKDVSQIFNNILRRQIGTRSPTVEYISAHPHILFMLLKGEPGLSWSQGKQACLQHEPSKLAIFEDYEKLLHSENYVTKRQSLKVKYNFLLGLQSSALSTKSKTEGKQQHTQVFVASPNKTQPIVEILLKNQPKLIEFLSNFQKERTDDEQFTDEKNYLIKQIRDLKKPTA
uniref:Calcium binding protein 39 like n=1 Tax=Pavo cristatus TaxID=9049 RepID=A0A8C9LDG5_PAVCR